MVSPSSTRTKVFISYSHKDAKYLEQLVEHLAYYERNNLIEFWDDKKIIAGTQWREEIKRAIGYTKVAVLLISPSFLSSEFIAENELPPLLHAAKKEGAIILPVIIRPSNFEDTELANFQAVNSPSIPVAKLKGYQRDALWVEVVKDIKRALASTQESIPDKTPYQILGNDVKPESTKASPDLASGLFSYVPLHKNQYSMAENVLHQQRLSSASKISWKKLKPEALGDEESQKVIDEVFRLGCLVGGEGKLFGNISNVRIYRSEDGQIIRITYDQC